MRRKDVKTIVAYYYGIPAQRRLLDKERAELEDEYNGLHGTPMDGMPHSPASGKPTEDLAANAEAENTWVRIQEISIKVQVLHADEARIRDCLDTIKGEYKRLIFSKYRDKYSWPKISVMIGAPDRTIRRWHNKALDRLGEALEEVPMVEELLGRASRARV